MCSPRLDDRCGFRAPSQQIRPTIFLRLPTFPLLKSFQQSVYWMLPHFRPAGPQAVHEIAGRKMCQTVFGLHLKHKRICASACHFRTPTSASKSKFGLLVALSAYKRFFGLAKYSRVALRKFVYEVTAENSLPRCA